MNDLRSFFVNMREMRYSDIEKVRQWRNQDRVRLNLFEQSVITQEQQEKWFASLGYSSQYYIFSDLENGRDVGLAFLKNLVWDGQGGCAEAGFFLGEEDYEGKGKVVFSALAGLNTIAFGKVDMLYCWIMNDNIPAIRMNKSLGYKMMRPHETKNASYYSLWRDDFFNSSVMSNLRRISIG